MPRASLWVLLLIVPLTLGLRSVEGKERMINGNQLVTDTASSLSEDGWSVRQLKHHLLGRLMEATRGDCRILVHFASPDGVSDEKYRQFASGVGPVNYQFRGRTTRNFPRAVPLLAAHAQRYAWSFGLRIPTSPLMAIARSPSCGRQVPNLSGIRQQFSPE